MSRWDVPVSESAIPRNASNTSDKSSKKRTNKWDQPGPVQADLPSRNSGSERLPNDTTWFNQQITGNQNQSTRLSRFDQGPTQQSPDWPQPSKSNGHEDITLVDASAAERARRLAAQLSAKLAAQGKYQTPPLSVLPKNSGDIGGRGSFLPSAGGMLPEVKKMIGGGYFAEYYINDVPARQFLLKPYAQTLISSQSGASVSCKGRWISDEDRQMNRFSSENPLHLFIQADIAAKVQVAVHKIHDVINRFDKEGPNFNANNYGLTPGIWDKGNALQEKTFVGVHDAPPDFHLLERINGHNNSNIEYIQAQSGAKVFLRGQGSGYLEMHTGRESFEALHLSISHPTKDGLSHARQLCENLIDTVRSDLQKWELQRNLYRHPPPAAFAYPPPPLVPTPSGRPPLVAPGTFQPQASLPRLPQDVSLPPPSFDSTVRARFPPYHGEIVRPPATPPRHEPSSSEMPGFEQNSAYSGSESRRYQGPVPPTFQAGMPPPQFESRFPYHPGALPSEYIRSTQQEADVSLRSGFRAGDEPSVRPSIHPEGGSDDEWQSADEHTPDHTASSAEVKKESLPKARSRSRRHSESRDRQNGSQDPEDRSRGRERDGVNDGQEREHARQRKPRRSRSRSRSRERTDADDVRSQRSTADERSQKSRRKFSEDPKLIEKVKKSQLDPSEREASSFKAPDLHALKKSGKESKKDSDAFKAPPPLLVLESAKKEAESKARVVKLGALSSLSAYGDDDDYSDED